MPPRKKAKVATTILNKDDYNWTAIANYLRNHSKEENGHILWNLLDIQGRPNLVAAIKDFYLPHVKNITSMPKVAKKYGWRLHRHLLPQAWYKMTIMKDVLPKTHMLKADPQCENSACIAHFKMVPSKGNPISQMEPEEFELLEHRFKTYCEPQESGCILWTGSKNVTFGKVKVNNHDEHAHRVALQMAKRIDLKEGEIVWHTCKEPLCVNPNHLLNGYARDLAAWKKANGIFKVGEQHCQSQISDQIRLQIINSFKSGKTAVARAKEVGASEDCVRAIDKAKTARHLMTKEQIAEREATRQPQSNLSQEQVEKIESTKGMSMADRVDETKISKHTIAKIDRGEHILQKTEEEVQHIKDERLFKSAKERIKANTTIFQDAQGVHLLWDGNPSQSDDWRYYMQYFNHQHPVSVASYLLFHRRKESTKGMHIAHSCRFKHCVAPDHLSEETPTENSHDRIRDGTMFYGEDVPGATLTNAQVILIWQTKEMGTRAERASAFGATECQVGSIDYEKAWTTVTHGYIPPITQDTLNLLQRAKETIVQRRKDGNLATIRKGVGKRKITEL